MISPSAAWCVASRVTPLGGLVAFFGYVLDQRMISVFLLALGITLGLLSPQLASACQPFALHALFLVVVFSLVPFVRLPTAVLVEIERGTLRIVAWQMIVLPAIVVAAGVLARLPESIIMLLVVTACGGSLFASPALAQLLGLDRKQALQCMLLSTLATPISLFAYLSILRGDGAVSLNIAEYLHRTFVFLVCPLLAFAVARLLWSRVPKAVSTGLEDGARLATVLALIVFGIGMMYPVSKALKVNPQQVVFFLFLAVFLSVFMFAATCIVLYRHGRIEAMTGAVLGAFRNVGLAFALVGDMTAPELDVYVGVSMLPIFMGPMVMQILLSDRSEAPAATPAVVRSGAASAPAAA